MADPWSRRASADAIDGHRRLIAAWCEDLASGDLCRTGLALRADAVCAARAIKAPERSPG